MDFNSSFILLKSTRCNLEGTLQHPTVVEEYTAEEITQHRVIGSSPKSAVPGVYISGFGVIPKRHIPNKWRLIVDLSNPTGHSVNDGIPKSLCSLYYVNADVAVRLILNAGPGVLLAKKDVKHAFCLLPDHPADRHLLVMSWKGNIFIDTCIPFGLQSAPKLFNILVNLLSWILENKGIHHLFISWMTSLLWVKQVHQHARTLSRRSARIWVFPLLWSLSQCLTFLGIILDTQHMEARLPPDKLSCIL